MSVNMGAKTVGRMRKMAQNGEPPRESEIGLHLLTKGELDCLALVNVRNGRRNLYSKEIGPRLGISSHTVDARLKAACEKLGTNSRFVAARMAEAAGLTKDGVTVTRPATNLVYENVPLPNLPDPDKRGPSAGEGYGSDDLEPQGTQRSASRRDSGTDRLRVEAKGPYATFFGGENRLSTGRRLIYIAAIAIGIAIAFGGIINGLVELSRMFSSP